MPSDVTLVGAMSKHTSHPGTAAAWSMPYELTLTIALEIAHPQIQYELRYDDVHAVSHDLNTFRLVCKAFDIIGKKAWGALAKVYPKCGYNTLCLPPKEKSLMDLAKIFLANEGVLGKLVTNIRLTVLPSTHAEFVNHGFGIGQWNSERPETPLCHSVVDQVHRRVIAVEQLMIGLGMSSNQMDFLRNAVTPASQAMLELILDKIPNAVSLDILTPDDMSWRSRVVTWVDEYDYVGCCKLMSSVSSQYDFASLTLSFGDLELVTPLPFSLSVPRITSMHIRTSEAFLERDTIIKALAIAKELTTLHLALEWAYHGYNQHMELLTSISVFPKLETFSLTRFVCAAPWHGSDLNHFLYSHRGTLKVVRLQGLVAHESITLDIVHFLRSKLKLNECGLELDSSQESVELRDLIRRLGGPAVKRQPETEHFAILSRYICRE